MNKEEFLSELREELYDLPEGDIEERLTFYSEMIDDRVEEGISVEEALAEIGPADEIASQIRSEVPKPEPAEETASEEFSALPAEASSEAVGAEEPAAKAPSDIPEETLSEAVTVEDVPVEEPSDMPAEAQPEAVAVEEIPAPEPAASIQAASLVQPSAEKESRRRTLRAWEIVLLVLGSPVWVSLLIAAVCIVLSLYISLWAVIISFWAVFLALAVSAVYSVISGVVCLVMGKGLAGLAMFGAALCCAGLAIFAFFGCKAASKGTVRLTKFIALKIKSLFIRKGESNE